MMFPLVQDLAAAGASPVAVTCRVLGFSKQAYYQWKKRPCSPRDASDARLINALRDAHDDDPTFGYRLLADEVVADGATASERRVWRLCHQEGIASEITTRKRGKGRRPGPAVHDDRVQREFTARGPNEIWLTDITEHATDEGKLYACAVKDVFAGKIVGYATGPRMTARLAVAALEDAVTRRGNVAGCIVHSDRGSQFRSRRFRKALRRHGLVGSMGRVGAAGDNAAMESFFSTLQTNVLDTRRWTTRAELRLAIIHWIEATYNRRRRQRRLGKLTPVEFETIMKPAVALAA